MGRYKNYKTDAALSKAIDAYFNSISRTVTAMEMVDTGHRNKKGQPIYKPQKMFNDEGQEIKVREYIQPPELRALCLFLQISRQTWANYKKRPEFLDTTTRACMRVEAYLAREAINRVKGIEGIKFVLMEDFGWREKIDVNQHQSVEDYLKEHPGTGQEEF